MEKRFYEPYFAQKKVTVMGLGLLGRGIGDTAFLARHGADILVTDKKTEEALAPSIALLKEYQTIFYALGEHRLTDFENRDFVLKAAGVPYDSEYVAHAEKSGVPVYMSAALLVSIVMKHLPSVTVIGVTGTRGKSTTTELIAHILTKNHSKVHLGGNIRGVANLPILEEIEDGDFLVLELDSWQLQGFGALKVSPHIAVFTSFMDDHMNYYKGDTKRYFLDKAEIYLHQKEGDVLFAGRGAAAAIGAYHKQQEVLIPEESRFETKLIGTHNQELISLAYEVAVQCGLDDESIREAVASFAAVTGRLEYMGEIKGVHVYNDNNATTEDATVRALESLYDTYNKKVVAIIGGTDKGLSVAKLEEAIEKYTKEVVYLEGTGTARISLAKEYLYSDLRECVQKAFALTSPGDVIVFSPSFASFSPYFSNEYERNDVFVEEVGKYRG
jgi:UDP-N-acetylmuramoylalanine--D-glutamate ligase